MTLIKRLMTAVALMCATVLAHAGPIGYWQLKDAGGNPTTVIRIYASGNTLNAKLVEYIPQKSARCTACKGDLQDKPLRGLPLITGLIPNGNNTWSGGRILNPQTGKTGKVLITLNTNGDTLIINSYGLLGSWFGSKDVWTRRR